MIILKALSNMNCLYTGHVLVLFNWLSCAKPELIVFFLTRITSRASISYNLVTTRNRYTTTYESWTPYYTIGPSDGSSNGRVGRISNIIFLLFV